MKLLFTSTAYPPSTGGAQLYAHMLAVHLRERHHIQVASFWDQNRTDWLLGTTLRLPTTPSDYEIDGIPVHKLALEPQVKNEMIPYLVIYYPWMSMAVKKISALIEPKLEPFAAQADLVHNIRVGREPLSWASYTIARKKGIPFLLTPLHHPRWKGWRYRVYQRLYQQADGLITLTAAEKQILVQLGAKEDRVFVTGMGPILAPQAQPDTFCKQRNIPGPFILFLGQHYEYKGFRQVLAAAPLVWQRVPEAHFVFIGPPIRDSEKYFQGSPDARIHRIGQVSLQEKTNALAACKLLCVPSSQESFGGVYTEAWSFQKPVIGCRIPSVSEVISDGVDGYLVDQNPAEIADRIIDLFLHPANTERMGKAGYQKVAERFSWPRLAEITEQVYQKVTGMPS